MVVLQKLMERIFFDFASVNSTRTISVYGGLVNIIILYVLIHLYWFLLRLSEMDWNGLKWNKKKRLHCCNRFNINMD